MVEQGALTLSPLERAGFCMPEERMTPDPPRQGSSMWIAEQEAGVAGQTVRRPSSEHRRGSAVRHDAVVPRRDRTGR